MKTSLLRGSLRGKFPSRRESSSDWFNEHMQWRKYIHILHPESPNFLRWEGYILVLLMYTVTVTPYQAGFLNPDGFQSSVALLIRCISDLSFVADIFVRLCLAYYDPIRGHYIDNPLKIARRYLRTWFLLDLVSSIPFDFFAELTMSGDELHEHSRTLSILRLLQMLKVARMGRFRRIMSELEIILNAKLGLWAAVEFFLLVVCIIHVTACGLGLLYENENQEHNWVSSYFGEDFEPSQFDRYIAALYWSVMTVTTVGFGDVPAQTNGERLYMSTAMMVGGGIWALILATITSGMLMKRRSNNELSRSVAAMDQLLKSIKASQTLKRQVHQYFVHQHRVPIGALGDHETLPKLSPLLRKLVAAQGCGERLKRLRVFNFCPTGLIGEIALLLKGQTFVGGEMLVRPGERAHQLFILQSGIVFKRGETDFSRVHEIRRVRSRLYVVGQAFGMDFLLGGLKAPRRHYSVMAKDYVDCLLLSRGDLVRVVDNYPDVKAMIRRNVIKFLFQGNVIDAINVIQAQRQEERESDYVQEPRPERVASATGGDRHAQSTPSPPRSAPSTSIQRPSLQHQRQTGSGEVLTGVDGSSLLLNSATTTFTTTRRINEDDDLLGEMRALLLSMENRFEKKVEALAAGMGELTAEVRVLTQKMQQAEQDAQQKTGAEDPRGRFWWAKNN